MPVCCASALLPVLRVESFQQAESVQSLHVSYLSDCFTAGTRRGTDRGGFAGCLPPVSGTVPSRVEAEPVTYPNEQNRRPCWTPQPGRVLQDATWPAGSPQPPPGRLRALGDRQELWAASPRCAVSGNPGTCGPGAQEARSYRAVRPGFPRRFTLIPLG